jgi:hypothetical protein
MKKEEGLKRPLTHPRYISITHNSQEVKATQVHGNELMDKKMSFPYRMEYFSALEL